MTKDATKSKKQRVKRKQHHPAGQQQQQHKQKQKQQQQTLSSPLKQGGKTGSQAQSGAASPCGRACRDRQCGNKDICCAGFSAPDRRPEVPMEYSIAQEAQRRLDAKCRISEEGRGSGLNGHGFFVYPCLLPNFLSISLLFLVACSDSISHYVCPSVGPSVTHLLFSLFDHA